MAKLAADLGGEWSTIGVIAPRTHMDDVLQALAEAGLNVSEQQSEYVLRKYVSDERETLNLAANKSVTQEFFQLTDDVKDQKLFEMLRGVDR